MSVLPVGIAASGDEGYTLDNSLRFRNVTTSSTHWLERTGLSGTATRWTTSFWAKFSKENPQRTFQVWENISGSYGFLVQLSGDSIHVIFDNYTGSGFSGSKITNAVLRDYSSWYHIVIEVDTNYASFSDDVVKIYINGVLQSQYNSTLYGTWTNGWTLNYNKMFLGAGNATGSSPQYGVNGYLTEINFIDGQALDATDFGETDATTGVWKPKAYSGTYGTNGFYLPTTATTQAEGFNTVLWTGNGTSQSIKNVGFNPDFVWVKTRTSGVGNTHHFLFDTVRGAPKRLLSSAASAEVSDATELTSFDTNGFSVGSDISLNGSGESVAGWCWDAGANQATTGISSVTFTANGSSGSVSGFGFSPDLIIAKNRTNGYSWEWWDTVRGVNSTLFSNLTNAEDTTANRIVSFDSDGFSYGTSSNIYVSSTKSVAYGFDAGDGDPVSNTQGTITSTVKANDANGFSIVSYTGDGNTGGAGSTVGHGLSTAPKVIIYKNRDSSTLNWMFTTTAIDGSLDFLFLNTTNSFGKTDSTENAPTSSVFSVAYAHNNTSGNDIIAYCFSEVSGVSSFGTYSGTGTTGNSVTGLGFKPGFLMIKRTDAAAEWVMVDSTRDPFNSANHILAANDSLAESSFGTTNRNIDFDSDGFTIQSTAAGGTTALNASGGTYMYMAFKGSYSDYVSPLNTDGSKPSRVKANTEKGFSIVSWEGNGSNSTIGHGLSSAPEFFFLKNRDTSVNDWIVYQSDVGATKFLRLNQTNATTTQTNIFNDTAPTSSVFTVGTNSAVNSSGVNYIAYCFHSVAGYSKFGSYTGTGTSGKAVTGLGFQPAFLMVKRTDAAEGWQMLDNTRNPVAPHNSLLEANQPNAEITNSSRNTTFDSDGFTINNTSNAMNASGGTYIYMAFADTRDAQFNFDASGNKNNWTPNNINSNASSESSYDIMTDVPTLTDEDTANYAVLNTVVPTNGGAVSDGNLTWTLTGSFGTKEVSIQSSTLLQYAEFYVTSGLPSFGVKTPGVNLNTNVGTAPAGYWGIYDNGATFNLLANGSGTYSTSTTVAAGQTWQVAYNPITGKAWIGKNNVWYNSSGGTNGDPATDANPTFSSLGNGLVMFVSGGNVSAVANANFGQRPFSYTPPTGFKALNTYNLPDATIEDGSEHFNSVLYTGTNADRSVTGVGFQPDFTWLKTRNVVGNNVLFDSNRGALKELYSNTTGTESAETNGLDYWESDGFHLKNARWNTSSTTYVSWNWKANGSGATNSDGDIDVTVSANTTSGFSIGTFTMPTSFSNLQLGHGLGVSPSMIILKRRNATGNWITWHESLGANGYLTLDTTSNSGSSSQSFNGVSATTHTLGSSAWWGTAGNTWVQYCFAPIEGFSSFGSYTGNGSTDGPFVYTGFRPAWIMVKRYTAVGNWQMFDSARDLYNPEDGRLYANLTDAENDQASVDFVSNGFKMRDTSGDNNSSGQSYIYMAFAENPFKNSLAR